jgi:hypothetical protein
MANLTGSWLAARFGVDPLRIERMRRAGELHAVRASGSSEWRYPSWQFEADGQTKPAVRRLLAAAHQEQIDALELDEVLERRKIGLVDGQSVREALLNGGEARALAEVRGAV